MTNSMWRVEVDRATAEEWSQMLDQFDDANIYQTAAYGGVRWGESNLSRLVLKLDNEAVAMAQFRIIQPTPFKFGIAYLRWGPLWEKRGRSLDSETPRRLALAIEDEYVKRRKLFVRILPNAFAGSRRAEVFQSAFSKFTLETQESREVYRTFLMDLTPSLEKLRSDFDKKWRNHLTRSEKNNLNVFSGHGSKDFRDFCEIYFQMRERKAFKSSVDVNEFGRIQDALPETQRMRILICKDDGVPVAGLVASAMGDSSIYLLGATSNAGLKTKGAYLLQWTMICWLKERGIKSYDLGGIDPEGNPGVYHFKKGFSAADICQIPPYTASESAISSGIVRVSLVMKRTIRASLRPLNIARSFKQPAPTS